MLLEELLQLQQGLGEQRRGGPEQLPKQRRRSSVQSLFSGATAGLALGQRSITSSTMRLFCLPPCTAQQTRMPAGARLQLARSSAWK